MNVRLATQVLSGSVFKSLQTFGPSEANATALYCHMFDRFFDCMNVRNSREAIIKIKPFLKPYESINDERFTWLTDTFLKYFTDGKIYIAARPGEFTDNERANIFLFWQTYEGIQILFTLQSS